MKRLAGLLIALAVGAACGGDNKGVILGPSAFNTAATEVYAGTLKVGEAGFYAFTLVQPGSVFVTFASLTSVATGAPLSTPMKIGLGVPAGTGCLLSRSVTVTTALTAQITNDMPQGIYCVSIEDVGGLTADADFAVRVTQGTILLQSSAAPASFTSNLAKDGASVRSFTVAAGGTLAVTIESLTPSVPVGLGLGVWRSDVSQCSISRAVVGTAGAAITIAGDQGHYCVRVFDVGNLTDFIRFSVRLSHP